MSAIAIKLLASKWVRLGLCIAVVAVLVMGGIHAVRSYWSDVRAEITESVEQKYIVRDLEESLRDAEADKVFAEQQSSAKDAELAALRGDLSAMSARVGQSRTIIRERVASGELTDGQLSPVAVATMEQIDQMEVERKAQ